MAGYVVKTKWRKGFKASSKSSSSSKEMLLDIYFQGHAFRYVNKLLFMWKKERVRILYIFIYVDDTQWW